MQPEKRSCQALDGLFAGRERYDVIVVESPEPSRFRLQRAKLLRGRKGPLPWQPPVEPVATPNTRSVSRKVWQDGILQELGSSSSCRPG